MSQQPEYSDWSQLMTLVKQAADQGQHEMLLTMLMTPDEREALVARVNILCETVKRRDVTAPGESDAGRGYRDDYSGLK